MSRHSDAAFRFQRLEESESRVTQSSRLTSDQAERLAKSEAINKQKDSEIQDLKQKVKC